MRDHPWFCIAGIWRQGPAGEAFTMLTMDAGEDVAPYHHRQIIPLTRDQWADWLDPSVPAQDVLRYLTKGRLPAARVFPSAPETERSDEHTSELQSLMRTSTAVICLKQKNNYNTTI